MLLSYSVKSNIIVYYKNTNDCHGVKGPFKQIIFNKGGRIQTGMLDSKQSKKEL